MTERVESGGGSGDEPGSESDWCSADSHDSDYWDDVSDISDDDTATQHVESTPNIADICAKPCCERLCMAGREKTLTDFFASLSEMTKRERQTCILTSLSILWTTKLSRAVEPTGDKTTRTRFQYRLPFVGQVCRSAFAECFGISTPTIDRYRQRIARGRVSAKPHGNRQNQNAIAIDVKKVVEWFQEFAAQVGEVVPVRVRHKTTSDGVVTKQVASKLYTFLPSYMTWQSILHDFEKCFEERLERVRVPSERSFRRILQRECTTILVRSPQANVCDECTIYKNSMTDAKDAEVFGSHVQTARRMRHAQKHQNPLLS
ncbi:hypothetical protein Ae201684_008806 [Aphanomyces euteiches]|uniref:Uncharacterized protein n=1 Tax=Aphanomyces euteiches TaxID=100861 RepID=A0A6G0X424_9STRA|nr:hypothetical protein Ae201684_008806 [Aphanomyces euteiches]